MPSLALVSEMQECQELITIIMALVIMKGVSFHSGFQIIV